MTRIRSIRTRSFSFVVGQDDDKGHKITRIKKEKGGYKVIAQGGDTFINAIEVVEEN